MTTENERWNEFVTRLAGEEGCNFTEDGKWQCSGKSERPFATNILEKMGNIDIPATMEYFEEHGGFCDCEILFNVAQ